jgi:hypothetical protein
MRTKRSSTRSPERRGSALILVLVLTVAVGALALSAVALTGHSGLVSRYYDREQEFRYASEAALAMGKSRLNADPYALPDSGFVTLMAGEPVVGADGEPLENLTAYLYAGPSGSTSGQFGRFASVVSDIRDPSGSRFVRRLELGQESFAKFAYWSDNERPNGTTIYFGSGDNLYGPVWSNDEISINSGGATFHSDVGTARTISGKQFGNFVKGYTENARPISLPATSDLAKLQGYAAGGSLAFVAPEGGDETTVRMRIEFIAIDLNADGDSTDADEGFLRVYVANAGGGSAAWLRGQYQNTNCGDWHRDTPGGPLRFYPVNAHVPNSWFTTAIRTGEPGLWPTATAANNHTSSMSTIMQRPGARCFLGGDPHLVFNENVGAAAQRGGDRNTFTAVGLRGQWLQWPGPVDARLTAPQPGLNRADAPYLFPLHRALNPGTKGVLHVSGSTGISGVLRGRLTIYATGNITVLDDLRYATDPAQAARVAGVCQDILGIISQNDVPVADNAINTPVSNNGWRVYDDAPHLDLHAIVMTLNTSFRVQNYSSGPTNALMCGATPRGRGCLNLAGGLIMVTRGAVGTSGGHGFLKRYSYDRCGLVKPPPYFPTTGRFLDNRYYEIDPVRFDVASLYASLVP